MSGPLAGVRIIELAGLGPGPFAAMLLADLGADVIRIDRGGQPQGPFAANSANPVSRGRRSIVVNLKHPDGVGVILRLAEGADALIEGNRPGVVERLGLGPAQVLDRNPRVVYGRVTGWGQDGPYASRAGHDINYIALAGVLHHMGRQGAPPTIPSTIVGDFAGGGMLLALGVVAAILEARLSGHGQVIDAAIIDGASLLVSAFAGWLGPTPRGSTIADGAAHFYETYATADGKYVSLGALEPKFYAEALRVLGLDPAELPQSMNRPQDWPSSKATIANVFKTRTRAEWCTAFEGVDACFAPVLRIDEAPDHPHHRARGSYVDVGGSLQAAPAPRFSRTPADVPKPPPGSPGADTADILLAAGFTAQEIADLQSSGAIQAAATRGDEARS